MMKTHKNLKLSSYTIESNLIKEENSFSRILYSTRTGKLCKVTESIWQSLSNEQFADLSSSMIEILKSDQFIVPKHEDELKSIIIENQDEISNTDTLYQVIQPSAWCQLGCGYCGQKHNKKLLSGLAQQSYIDRYEKRLIGGNYSNVSIGWFGGEPTTGMSVMRLMTPQLIDIAEKANCTYSAKIVTNGLGLTYKLAKELVDIHKVNEFEITLDGIEDFHDNRRFTKLNKPTFSRIFKNLKELVNIPNIKINIRCNVDRENIKGVKPLITKIAEHDLQKKINFYTAPIHSWGNDAHLTSLTKNEYAEYELEWLALQFRLGFNISILPSRKKIVCLAVRRDSELLDANDYSYNCTEVSQVPTYGKNSGYIIRESGNQEISYKDKALKISLFNDDILVGNQDQCKTCRMLPVCGGQCPKAWEEGLPPCPSPKFNIQGRLDLLYAVNKINQNITR